MPDLNDTLKALALAGYGAGHTLTGQDCDRLSVSIAWIDHTMREMIEAAGPQELYRLHDMAKANAQRNGEAKVPAADDETVDDADLLAFAVKVTVDNIGMLKMAELTPHERQGMASKITDHVLSVVRGADAKVSTDEAADAYLAIYDAIEKQSTIGSQPRIAQSPGELPTLDTGSPQA